MNGVSRETPTEEEYFLVKFRPHVCWHEGFNIIA